MATMILSADVICDDCGKALRRMAPPHTPHSKMAEKRLLRQVRALASARRWSVEGPSAMAGDLCARCNSVSEMAREVWT